MKKFNILFIFSIFCWTFSYSQTSHQSGYYDKDSIFFEIFWEAENNQKIEWSVNNFSENSFTEYNGGIWLKNRDYTENTWENIHVYKNNGFVYPIIFNGFGLNDIRVFGKNNIDDPVRIKIEVVENQKEGDLFNVYEIDNNKVYQLIEKKKLLFTKSSNSTNLFNSEDGWFIESKSHVGHTVGDYWEININPYRNECSNYTIDYESEKGPLKKVNTIRVRLMDTVAHSIDREETFIIGIGERPHDHHIFFATVDSIDIISMLSTTSEKEKAKCYLVILNPENKIEFSDYVQIGIAAGSSICFPNKGVAFKAKNKLSINGTKTITTTIFSDTIQSINKIKFRVGGAGQLGSYASHEIIQQLLQDNNQKLGGVENSVATCYINGSYWSLGFPQEQPRKEFYSNLFSTNSKSINIANSIKGVFIDTIFKKEKDLVKGNYIIFSDELFQSENFPFPQKEMFIPNTWLKEPITIFNKLKNSFQVVAGIKDGNKRNLNLALQDIMDLPTELSIINNSFTKLQEIINVGDWCKYFSILHFLGKDFIDNNIYISLDLENKLFPILIDFDDLMKSDYDAHKSWKAIFNEPKEYYEDITHKIAVIISKSDIGQELLFKTYFHLIQTDFREEKIIKIINSTKEKVMKEYKTHYESWGGYPNGGVHYNDQESRFDYYLGTLLSRRNIVQEFLNKLSH